MSQESTGIHWLLSDTNFILSRMCLTAEKIGAIQLPYASSRYIMGHIGQCR